MKRHKYKVSPASERTWNGVVYASKAECAFAQWARLHGIPCRRGESIRLAGGVVYKPDFFVKVMPGSESDSAYVDVKGIETPAFRLKMRLYIADPAMRFPVVTVKAIYRGGRITGFKVDQVWEPGKPAPRRARKKV